MTRGQRGRLISQVLFAVAAGAIASTLLLLVAAPGGPAPMFGPPALMTIGPGILGCVGAVFGLVWMIRIYREDPEPDHRAWRYREHD